MLMGDLLEEFFKRPYIAAKVAEGKLPDTWREIVGDRAADVTTELRLEKHILYVRIQSSVLRSELFYQREALCEENPPFGRTARQRRHHPVSPGSAKKHTLYNIHEKRCSRMEHLFLYGGKVPFALPNTARPYLMITARLAFWLFS